MIRDTGNYSLFRDMNLDMYALRGKGQSGVVYKLRIGTADGDEDPQEFDNAPELIDYLKGYLDRMEYILQKWALKEREEVKNDL